MRNSILSIFLLSVLGVPAVATAGYSWTGTQVMTPFSMEVTYSDVGFRAQYANFWVPKDEKKEGYIYLGPTFSAKVGDVELWVSPQAVTFLGWFYGADAFGASLWADVSYNQWSLFLESDYLASEFIFAEVYYGYYALNWTHGEEIVNLGLQVEQADLDLFLGPHAGFTVEFDDGPSAYFELQYYAQFVDGEVLHGARAVFGLDFLIEKSRVHGGDLGSTAQPLRLER